MAADTRWFKSPYVGVVSFLGSNSPVRRTAPASRHCLGPLAPCPTMSRYATAQMARQVGSSTWDILRHADSDGWMFLCVCVSVAIEGIAATEPKATRTRRHSLIHKQLA